MVILFTHGGGWLDGINALNPLGVLSPAGFLRLGRQLGLHAFSAEVELQPPRQIQVHN